MKKALLQKMTTGMFALVMILLAMPNGRQAEAQYCGFDYVQYWQPYAVIDGVTITDVSENTVVLDRQGTGWEFWADVDETGEIAELIIGNKYEIDVYWGCVYNHYLQVYLDKDQDQRWDFSRIGPDEEMLIDFYTYQGFVYPAEPSFHTIIPFNVGDDVQEGESQLRIVAAYAWYTPDPCIMSLIPGYQWGYGEAEDYRIKFVASVPETYPTAGNILFNKEEYDGTNRMFKGELTEFRLPAVEFKSPLAAPGTRIEYWIQGPLPSTDVVYRGLNPGTQDPKISMPLGTQVYEMQSATGSASVSLSEGTFAPTKGGEYKVNVKLIKPNGKEAQAINVFTVANDYDMAVSGITSPRTSRFPRFFKYLRSTNIGVACDVQNTGLNTVKKFEVTAKIYDADTDVLVSTPPKVLFDSDNNPAQLPLLTGQKFEASFAAFNTPFVGEYYVEFEVKYIFDEEKYNNTLPRPDNVKHYFSVQYNDQLTAGHFQNPVDGDTLKVNKPTNPQVWFYNNGISDASNINFHMVVKNDAGVEVYNEVSTLEDLPQGQYNSKLVTFANMIISEPGMYDACAWVDYPFDSKHDDDTTCISFYVELGNSGVITVGETNEGGLTSGSNDYLIDNGNEEVKNVDLEGLTIENTEFNFNGFSPNPATTSTIVTFETKSTLTLEVVDMNGNVVFTDNAEGTSYNLNTSNFASGTYTVVLRNENGVQTKQLSVVR